MKEIGVVGGKPSGREVAVLGVVAGHSGCSTGHGALCACSPRLLLGPCVFQANLTPEIQAATARCDCLEFARLC
jgi:hypothetical protein